MWITESQLRRIIREVLSEDLAGFRKRTEHIRYGAGVNEFNPDTTFMNDPENRAAAKAVKSAWAAEADHDFMRSLVKVHWIVYPEQAATFMGISGKNEISVKGYLPHTKLDRPLGGVGFIVQGRVTLAANSQDTIYSGMSGHLPPETHKHFAPSGTPKRARNFNYWISANYMLDEKSFMPEQHNELIVGNWKIIAIVIDMPKVLSSFTGSGRYDWTPAMRPIIESGFPLYDMDMKPVSPGKILQAMKDAEGKPKVYDFDQKTSEGNLRQLTSESIADEFRAQLLARKKYYDDLARQPLPYKEGDTVRPKDKTWVGTVRGTPVIIEPGTSLNVITLASPTDGEFKLLEPATLQVPETAVRMMRLTEDTLDVSPDDTIRIQGAQLRNVQQNRFTDAQHRLAARLVDRLNDAVYDIANKRIKQDGHFLTRDEAEEYFQTLFDALPPGPFKSLEELRAAHSEFTDILMRRAGGD